MNAPRWTDTGPAARIDGGPWVRTKIESPDGGPPRPPLVSFADWILETPAERTARSDAVRAYCESLLEKLRGGR